MPICRREMKGLQIVAENGVTKVDDGLYSVKSQSNPNISYIVSIEKGKMVCNCKDFAKGKRCKHWYAVKYYIMLMDLRKKATYLSSKSEAAVCPTCKSTFIEKAGYRYNKNGTVQRYRCKTCGKWFRDPHVLEGSRFSAEIVSTAIDLYCRGLSLREVSEHFASAYGTKISYGTIYSWLKKYVELIHKYTSKFTGNLSERWHADETLLNVRGRDLLLWNLLDSETRFLIAYHISANKSEKEAGALIKKGLRKSLPWEVITDGNPSYAKALAKEAKDNQPLIHVIGPLAGPISNNLVERFNQTIKKRAKVAVHFNESRGVETFMQAFSIYYNFIRPHQALGNSTPAEKAGIMEKTNWRELIMLAKSKKPCKTKL